MGIARPTHLSCEKPTMKKIALNLEDLAVDSFATGGTNDRLGTVHAHGTEMTVCVGLCGGYDETEAGGCESPTRDGCVYPTAAYHSCEPGQTYDEYTCHCLYVDTDARMCCTVDGCSGGGMC